MKSQKIISLNPSRNYQTIGEVPITSKGTIDAKVAQARAAQPAWAALGVKARVALLQKAYDAFVARKNEITTIASQEMGMPVTISNKVDIEAGLQYLRGYLDNAEQWLAPEITFENEQDIHSLFFEPKGVAGVSVPWNFPFLNFIWAVMQNLIVGNTVVFKHSEECPLTGKLLEDIMQTTKLPDGVFNQVFGDGSDAGEYLMNSNIDLIFFTGSTGVGKHLYQVAAKKFISATLELGGSAPGIVFDDVDLPTTLESIYFNRFVNSGQSCDALKRLIVQRSKFDTVVQALQQIVSTKTIGDASNPTTDLGPLVNERQLITIEAQVADALQKGATVVTGGKRPTHIIGAYYKPTILININPTMRVWHEEVFGPVLPIVPFDTEQEAITLANDTQYGLGAYVYTNNKEQALRVSKQLQAGNVSINGVLFEIPQNPFGGYKNSGIGREHGKQGLRELCSLKIISMKK